MTAARRVSAPCPGATGAAKPGAYTMTVRQSGGSNSTEAGTGADPVTRPSPSTSSSATSTSPNRAARGLPSPGPGTTVTSTTVAPPRRTTAHSAGATASTAPAGTSIQSTADVPVSTVVPTPPGPP